VAVLIALERSLDRYSAAIDDDIFEAGRLRLLRHVENGAARLARYLDPARQDIVELQGGQVGFNAATAIGPCDLARQLDRKRAADSGAEIQSEPRAAGIIEC